jgi:uncharacterized lipoprotein NlpE involved in copper resistance
MTEYEDEEDDEMSETIQKVMDENKDLFSGSELYVCEDGSHLICDQGGCIIHSSLNGYSSMENFSMILEKLEKLFSPHGLFCELRNSEALAVYES